MSQEERSRLGTYASMPEELRRATLHLIADMSATTGENEAAAVFEALPSFVRETREADPDRRLNSRRHRRRSIWDEARRAGYLA